MPSWRWLEFTKHISPPKRTSRLPAVSTAHFSPASSRSSTHWSKGQSVCLLKPVVVHQHQVHDETVVTLARFTIQRDVALDVGRPPDRHLDWQVRCLTDHRCLLVAVRATLILPPLVCSLCWKARMHAISLSLPKCDPQVGQFHFRSHPDGAASVHAVLTF